MEGLFITENPVVDFANNAGFVKKKGKIFEAGDYPDKDFSLTPDEMKKAISNFTPRKNRIQHVDTILNGHLGTLDAVWQGASEVDLEGEISIPSWLNEVIGDDPLKVSCEWDRQKKEIIGLGLVIEGRVPDAAVMAAFEKTHDTRQGQNHLQAIHDESTRAGAVCNAPAEMASKHEHSAIQKIHNLASEHGATCDNYDKSKVPSYPSYYSAESKDKKMELTLDNLPKLFAGIAETLGFKKPESEESNSASTANFAESKEYKEMQANFLRIQSESVRERAVTFAQTQLNANKILPNQVPFVMEQYIAAANNDATLGKVVFDDKTEKSHIEILTAFFEAQMAHSFTEEQIKAKLDGASVLDNKSTADFSEERRVSLLKATPLGEAILKEGK